MTECHLSPPSSPTTPSHQSPPSPIRTSSRGHVTSFLGIPRQNERGPLRPRPLSLTSTSSGVHHRVMDAIGGSLTRQLSMASASDVSSIAIRPAQVGGTHSREPLLPISIIRKPVPYLDPNTNTNTNTGRVRSSLEKIFKRGTSADSIAAPSSMGSSTRPSPRQLKFVPDQVDMPPPPSPSSFKDGYFPSQPSPRHAPPAHPAPPPSRHPGFSQMPPPDTTPFVPYISPKTGKPERNYVDYPSRNTFFLHGRLLTGGDSPLPFIASFILLLAIAGTWFATTCVWWWHNESPAVAAVGAYMCLVTVASMLATVCNSFLFVHF